MNLLLQAITPDSADVAQFIKGLGVPGAWLAVAAYTVRKIVIWAMPHVEAMIAAYLSRQSTMEECSRKLTESTIEIQRQNQESLRAIQEKLPALCQASKCLFNPNK